MIKKIKEIENLKKRILMCVIGVLVGAVSVGFFKRAAFGVDPFQTFMAGLELLVPFSFGTMYVISNAIMLVFSLIFDRHYIGLATLINLTLTGYVSKFTQNILLFLFPDLGIAGRAVCLAIGVIVMCVASAYYFTADLGVSVYDAVALIITQTWKKGKFKYVRIITDFCCVATGCILYFISGSEWKGLFAIVGVGTIITAFFMGPLIDLFNRKLAQPFLYGKEKANHQ